MALIVAESQLPGAGKGLFTTKPIKAGSKIIEYRGEIIDWKEYVHRVNQDKDGYVFYITRKKCIDSYNTPQYKARYVNDAEGLVRVKGLENNAQFQNFDNRCFVVAIRDIQAGEEIFAGYTKEYWECVRYNIENNLYGPERLALYRRMLGQSRRRPGRKVE